MSASTKTSSIISDGRKSVSTATNIRISLSWAVFFLLRFGLDIDNPFSALARIAVEVKVLLFLVNLYDISVCSASDGEGKSVDGEAEVGIGRQMKYQRFVGVEMFTDGRFLRRVFSATGCGAGCGVDSHPGRGERAQGSRSGRPDQRYCTDLSLGIRQRNPMYAECGYNLLAQLNVNDLVGWPRFRDYAQVLTRAWSLNLSPRANCPALVRSTCGLEANEILSRSPEAVAKTFAEQIKDRFTLFAHWVWQQLDSGARRLAQVTHVCYPILDSASIPRRGAPRANLGLSHLERTRISQAGFDLNLPHLIAEANSKVITEAVRTRPAGKRQSVIG